MQFRRILGLSSFASSGSELPSEVISVLVTRLFTLYSSSGRAGLCTSTGSSSSKDLQLLEEDQDIGVSVWWDFESCNLPAGVNGFKAVQAITAAIRSCRIGGPISITAFGDIYKPSMINQFRALSSAGIALKCVPQDEKTSSGLRCWVPQTPPPLHIFLISSNDAFVSALHRLRLDNYNILLASKTYAVDNLFTAATMIWDWCSLVEGKSVTGIFYEMPPFGPYNPWYGMIPLPDPFAAVEQSNSVKTEESPASNSNLKIEKSIAFSKTPLRLDFGYGPSASSDQSVGVNENDKSKSPSFFDRIMLWFR